MIVDELDDSDGLEAHQQTSCALQIHLLSVSSDRGAFPAAADITGAEDAGTDSTSAVE